LITLLNRGSQYAIPPEDVLGLLTWTALFQDDRLDLLDERINERLTARETILTVIRVLERADNTVESAADLRWIIIGMEEPGDVPDENAINGAIQLLSHSSLGVFERVEEGYQTVTNYENAVELLQSLDAVIQSVNEQES
jgi:hypothetical protein